MEEGSCHDVAGEEQREKERWDEVEVGAMQEHDVTQGNHPPEVES